MPAKKENRMRKEFEEKDIHQEVRRASAQGVKQTA